MSDFSLNGLHEALDAPIPRSAVKQREGAAKRSFSYLSTDYVINRMNQLFGNLNWSSDTIDNRCVYEGEIVDQYNKKKCTCHYVARVTVTVSYFEGGRSITASHTGTGYGDGTDAMNPGKAHELATKEAESDALKRACKNFGQSMGLALYDKEQTNVIDDSPKGKTPTTAASVSSSTPTLPKTAPVTSSPNSRVSPSLKPAPLKKPFWDDEPPPGRF